MPPDRKTIEQYVCPDCFNDEALKRVANARAVRNECGFCDSRSNVPIAAPLDVLVAAIRAGLQSCYTTDTQQVEFDDEGHPLVGQPYTTESLLGDVDWMNPRELPPIRNAKVLQEVVRAISETDWYTLTLTPELRFGRLMLSWADFCWRIRKKSRFFFGPMRGDAALLEPEQFPTLAILDEFADLVRSAALVRTIPVGTTYFRARQHPSQKKIDSADEIGPPPSGNTRSNRMSPAGIVMFYGAVEKETAWSETYDSDGEEMLTVASFRTLHPFKIIDLTHLPTIPSIYDPDRRQIRTGIQFLHGFAEQVAAPVVRDRREHVAYVPTQVVTEYFRHVFRDQSGEEIRGVLYPSSRQRGGTCCALFFEADQCGGKPAFNLLGERCSWLRLEDRSIERHRIADVLSLVWKP